MSDLFGLLPLPVPVPEDGAALADPALDMLLAFMRAVLNADLGDAWAERAPTETDPVSYVFAHEPRLESFNMDETPALYAWRADDAGAGRYSQDLVADEAGITVLWVPPALPQEDVRLLESVRNGIKKSLKAAFGQGRHPAWVIDGDSYYEPEIYGSVLLYHAKLGKARLGAFRSHVLQVASPDGSFRKNFDCLLFQLEVLEFFQRDLSAETALDHAAATISLALPGAREDALSVLSAEFEPELLSLSAATGAAAGGDVLTLSGKQLSAAGPDGESSEVEVYLGTLAELEAGTAEQADPDTVSLDSETELTFTTPPHAAGAVSVRVLFPSGVEKTLEDAFTYV